MKALGVSLATSNRISPAEVLRLARLAEDMGFHSVWIPETWGTDAVSLLAALARETSAIRLASGVFNVFSRSAGLIAQTAATLQNMSGGRFLLGLGTSGPIVVRDWHGMEYERPVQRTREYVEVISAALRGTRVDHRGPIIQIQGFRLQNPPADPPPLYLAALGPRNVRLTGEVADGWLPIFAPRGRVRLLRSDLDAGAKAVGRDPASITTAAYLPVMVGPRGTNLLQQHLAYYVGGMGTYYARFLSDAGLKPEVDAIRSKWASGDRTGAARSVGDRLMGSCCLGSETAAAKRRLADYRNEGVGLPILTVPHGARAEDVEETMEALRPDND